MSRSVLLALTIGAIAAISDPVQAQTSSSSNINLFCTGEGQHNRDNVVDTLEWDKWDHRYRTRVGVQSSVQTFAEAVTVQISGTEGRIRLASTMIPLIHSHGDRQNWWQLKNIRMTADDIQATYDLSGVNEAKVSIDRQTGSIRIKSLGPDYNGVCSKVDPDQRRF